MTLDMEPNSKHLTHQCDISKQLYEEQVANLRNELDNLNSSHKANISLLEQQQQKQLASMRDDLKEQYEKRIKQLSLEMKTEKTKQLQEKHQEIVKRNQNLETQIRSLTLFDKNIGDIVLQGMKTKVFDLSSSFKKIYDIPQFYTAELDEMAKSLSAESNQLKTENTNLKKQIEQFQNQEKFLKKDFVDNIQSKDLKIQELELANKNLVEEKNRFIAENNKLSIENNELREKLEGLRSQSHEIWESKFISLSTKVSSLSQQKTYLEESNLKKVREISRLNESLVGMEKTIKELKENTQFLNITNKNLKKKMGDATEMITFSNTCKVRLDITKDMYERLMVDDVEKMNLVELQNIIKNLILLFEIPLNKLTKRLPLMVIVFMYEKPLFSYFVNRLFYQIKNEQLDLKHFTDDTYRQYLEGNSIKNLNHPLKDVLEELFQYIVTKL